MREIIRQQLCERCGVLTMDLAADDENPEFSGIAKHQGWHEEIDMKDRACAGEG